MPTVAWARSGVLITSVRRFQACVACDLASAKFATRGYLIEHFPHYLQDRAAQAELLGPLLYAGRKNGPFAGTKFSWFHVEDFNDHKLDAKGVVDAEALVKAKHAFEEVLDYKDKGMAAAAAFRMGQILYEFAQNLFDAPVPPGRDVDLGRGAHGGYSPPRGRFRIH